MDQAALIDGLIGWSVGYAYSNEKKREDEIKQGKNYYLASLSQVSELSQVCVLISKINETLPPHLLTTPVKVFCNLGPLLSLPAFLFCASVKQGEHEKLAEWFNGTRYAYIKLPENLDGRTVTFLSFFAEHSGNIFRVAMVATSVALIALGKATYGGAVLTALAYEAMDTMGFIPRRISLFMEIYMPTVSLMGLIAGGTTLVRVISAVALSTHVMPFFATYLHQRIDALIRHVFSMEGANLMAIDAPLVEKHEMTFDEINQILNDERYHFEINPAHCSHPLLDIEKLPKDKDFGKLLTLFDTIDWESKYDSVVKGKLIDDDRFVDYLLVKFPWKTKEELQDDAESYIKELAEQEGISKERFAANWMRAQMVELVDILQGNKRVKGLQQDLDEAIQDAAILLPYISALQNEIEKEDALLKLAVEGGDYCGRGIKRAANEMIRGMIQGGVQQDDDFGDPIRNYEMQVLQTLQNRRHDIIQLIYKKLAQQLKIPDAVSQDTHGFDIYRLYFSLGFYPLTKHERHRVGLPELCTWELYNKARIAMYDKYFYETIDDAVEEIGNAHFGVYVANIINANDQLTKTEKEALLEKFTERNDGKWTVKETHTRFYTLMFVRLGVLRPRWCRQEFIGSAG